MGVRFLQYEWWIVRHIEPIQSEAVTHPVGRSSGESCPRLTPATAPTEGFATWARRQWKEDGGAFVGLCD